MKGAPFFSKVASQTPLAKESTCRAKLQSEKRDAAICLIVRNFKSSYPDPFIGVLRKFRSGGALFTSDNRFDVKTHEPFNRYNGKKMDNIGVLWADIEENCFTKGRKNGKYMSAVRLSEEIFIGIDAAVIGKISPRLRAATEYYYDIEARRRDRVIVSLGVMK